MEINNEHTIIRLRDDGIVELQCNDSHVYEVDDIKQNHEAIKKVSSGKKALVLNLVGKYSSISNEGKDFVAKGTHKNFIRAEAFVLHSLAQRILARFYIRLSRPVVKTAYFSNQEDAIKWLKNVK